MAAAEIEAALLRQVHQDGGLADSGDFAAANGWEHTAVVGVIKSLEAAEMITTQVRRKRRPHPALRCAALRVLLHVRAEPRALLP